MKKQPSLAYQRKRPRFKSNGPVGVKRPGGPPGSGPSDHQDQEDGESPSTMEARTQEAEAAYQFSGDEAEESAAPTQQSQPRQERQHTDRDAPRNQESSEENPSGDGAPSTDPAALRREQERMRRDQERDRRENERKERDRRENERREQQKREQDRRERDRMMEMRNLNVDVICERAWDIYSAEVKEEGVELFPDNEARELCKRSFRLAEIFLLEEARLRKMRSEPIPPEPAPEATEAPAAAAEPTMGE